MLIQLEEPFKSKWNKGYLQSHPNNRKYICLFNNDDDRTLISYARYLMGVKLGYEVPSEYEVDHIDNDKTNDDINNLQLLTQEQNRIKQEWHYVEYVQNCYGVECNWCGTHFLLTERQVKMKLAAGVNDVFCSKSCSANYNHTYNFNLKKTLTNETIQHIKNLKSQGLSSYKIADKLSISRNTVMKYW